MNYIYRVTASNWGRTVVKVGTRKMLAGMLGEQTSAAQTAKYRGHEPRYKILKVERAPVSAFEDVTAEFQR